MPDAGRNSGLTGLFDFPGIGGGAKFEGKIVRHQARSEAQTRPRRGRGGGRYRTIRFLYSLASGGATARPRLDGWPAPDSLGVQPGTVTHQVDTGKTITYPIDATLFAIEYDPKVMDRPFLTFAYEVTGPPVFAGWSGTQPAATTDTRADQTQWEISSKTLDPKGLQSTATRFIDIWGALNDTDSAEQTKLLAVIAAATPPITTPHNAKLRSSTFARDAIDGGTITEIWGLRDTAEDETNPRTFTKADPKSLGNAASVAAINSIPATPSGYVDRGVTSTELNDSNILYTKEAGARSTEDDVTYPGTVDGSDPYDLADTATVTLVTASSTPPATPAAPIGQIVEIESERLTQIPERWRHTFKFSNLNSEQRIEFPAAEIVTDPSALEDTDRQADVTDTSTVPATPTSRFTDGKLRKIRSTRVGGVPEKWLHVWEFGRRTTQQDIEMPGSVTDDEVSSIADEARITQVTSSGTPPATPAAPVGQLLSIESEQLHGSNGGKWRHTWKYGNTTALQKIQFPTDTQEADPSLLQDEDHQSDVTATSTAPAAPATRIVGLVLRLTTSVRIAGTPEKWLHRWFFGRRSTEEDITYPGTVTSDEVSNVADEATITVVTSSGTPPTTPAAPVGQLLEIRSERLTDAGKWKHTFTYGNTTALQRIQFPTDVVETDPSALKDEDHQSATTSTSTVPAAPTTRVAGLVLRTVTSKRISGTPELWLHQWEFGRRSTAEDVTFPGTVTYYDQSDLRDSATITLLTSGSTPPATPASPVGVLISIESEQLTDAGKWRHTFKFANTTNAQAITFPKSPVEDDPSDLTDSDAQTILTSSSTPPSTPTTRIAGLKFRRRISVRVSGTPEQWAHTFEFGRRTTQEDIEFPGTSSDVAPDNIGDSAETTLVTGNAVQPDPGAPVGVLLSYFSVQIHDGSDGPKYKHVYKYGNTTPKQKIEYDGTDDQVDASGLKDETRVTSVTTSSTPPATPTAAGLKFRSRLSQRLQGTPEKWRHTFTLARRNTEDDAEMGGTAYDVDESALESTAEVTVVEADGTPDGGVTVSGMILKDIRKKQIHDTKWEITYRFGPRTNEQEVTFPGTVATDDPSNIIDRATVTLVNTSSTYPSALDTPPSGLKLRGVSSEQRTNSGKWVHKAEYGRQNQEDEVEQGGTQYVVDQSGNIVGGSARVTIVETDSTPDGGVTVAGLVLRDIEKKQLHDSKWAITYIFGQSTHEDELELDGTEYLNDPSNLADRAQVTLLNASSTYPVGLDTPPATPTTGTLKLRGVKSKKLATTSGVWQHTGIYGLTTEEDDVEMRGTVTETDQSSNVVAGEARVVVIEADGTPDGGVSVSGQVLRFIAKKQLNDGKWEMTYVFGQRTPEQDITFEGTDYKNDPGNLKDSARVTLVNGTSTYPVALDTPPTVPTTGTLFLREVISRQHTSGGQWIHTGVYGLQTNAQEIENDTTDVEVDQEKFYDEKIASVVSYSGTARALADSLFSANQSDQTFLGVKVKKLTPDRALQILRKSGENKAIFAGSNHVFRDSVRGVPTKGIVAGEYRPGAVETTDTQATILIRTRLGTMIALSQFIWRSLGRFTFRRIYSAANITATQYLSLRGQSNNAAFLGFLRGEVVYSGPSSVYTFAIAGAHRLMVDYEFQTDNWKWFNDGWLPSGPTYLIAGGTTPSNFYLSSFFEIGLGVSFPEQADFSGFTA